VLAALSQHHALARHALRNGVTAAIFMTLPRGLFAVHMLVMAVPSVSHLPRLYRLKGYHRFARRRFGHLFATTLACSLKPTARRVLPRLLYCGRTGRGRHFTGRHACAWTRTHASPQAW